MKPIWKDGKLTVKLHVPDVEILHKARCIGEALAAMNQATGPPLVDAIDDILCVDMDSVTTAGERGARTDD